MGQITWNDKTENGGVPPEGIVSANDMNDIKSSVNDNNTRVNDIEQAEGNIITELADLPAPSGGVIELNQSDVDYLFIGNVDISPNVIEVTGQNVKIRGTYAERDAIVTDSTGVVITNTTSNCLLEDICIDAPNASDVFSFANSNTKIFQLDRVKISSGGSLGIITNPLSFSVFDCQIAGTSGPFSIVGNGGGNGIIGRFTNTLCLGHSSPILNLGTSEFSAIDIGENAVYGEVSGASFLLIANDGANITAEGEGTITRNKFVDTFGGLTAISGDYVFSPKWAVGFNTPNILPSDRIEPTGFGNYDDDVTSNINVTTTWTKVNINGLGGATRTDKLPLSIRGVSELFDVSTSTIKAITDGDSLTFRLPITIASTSGNPTYLEFALDIGTSEVSPNNIILGDSRDLNNVTDQPVVFSSNYFTGTTFLANDGRFFLRTDSGSCVVSSRSTEIQRVSSGAS